MILNLTDYSSEPLHAQIARQVRTRLLDGSVDPGTRFEPRRFARRQRVSVTSVERAFGDLAAEGLLEATDDGHFRVAPLEPEQRRDLTQQHQFEAMREEALSAQELELAREIQCRLLPPPRVDGPGWTVVARNAPARFVAGDFYDLLRHGDGSVDLVVADVAGKGIGPSLIMASVKAVLPFLTEGRPVVDAMAELNGRLHRELGRREFIALALARFRPRSGRLELANAGLPDPYRLRPVRDRRAPPGSYEIRTLEVPGPRLPLGVRAEVDYRSLSVTLDPGERLLMISDGLPEAVTDGGEPFGYGRLEKLLSTAGTADDAPAPDAESWLDTALDGLRRATDLVQPDDWTAMVLERRR